MQSAIKHQIFQNTVFENNQKKSYLTTLRTKFISKVKYLNSREKVRMRHFLDFHTV